MQNATTDANRTHPHPGPAALGTEGATVQQFLRFALSEERYAVRIDAVREILEVARMTPLPLMPSFVRGVMNLRGAVVPVVDIGARLGMAPANISKRSCVVIVDIVSPDEQAPQRLGILVDAVYEVVDAAQDELESVPRLGSRIDPSYVRSMVRVRGQATQELDIAAILEQQTLTELIAEHSNHVAEPGLAVARSQPNPAIQRPLQSH